MHPFRWRLAQVVPFCTECVVQECNAKIYLEFEAAVLLQRTVCFPRLEPIFVICCRLARAEVGPKQYRKYLKKDGRFKFQVDLGIALLNYAIGAEWDDLSKPPPEWMHSKDWVPCECKLCFFCLNWLTNGIIHKKKPKVVTTFIPHDNTHTKQKGRSDQRVQMNRGSQF